MRDQLDSHRLLAIPSSPHRLLFQLPVTVRQSDIDNQAGVRGIKAHASTGACHQNTPPAKEQGWGSVGGGGAGFLAYTSCLIETVQQAIESKLSSLPDYRQSFPCVKYLLKQKVDLTNYNWGILAVWAFAI